MTTNTDVERLIADLERRSEVHAELAKQGKKAEPWPELLARAATALRTMQAERDAALKEVRFHVDDAVKAWNAHEAAVDALVKAAEPKCLRVITTHGPPNADGQKWVHWADYQELKQQVEAALATENQTNG